MDPSIQLQHDLDNALIREKLLLGVLAAHGIDNPLDDNAKAVLAVERNLASVEMSVGDSHALSRDCNMSVLDYQTTFTETFNLMFSPDSDPYSRILELGMGVLTLEDAERLYKMYLSDSQISEDLAEEHLAEQSNWNGGWGDDT